MGAPITAYNRISDEVIRVHSNIYDPEFVVVVDESLLETVDVTAGLKKEGAILVNTAARKKRDYSTSERIRRKTFTRLMHTKYLWKLWEKYFPNTPLLAAIVKVANIMDEETFLREMQASFKHKFASKPEVIDGNMKALEMALKEVK